MENYKKNLITSHQLKKKTNKTKPQSARAKQVPLKKENVDNNYDTFLHHLYPPSREYIAKILKQV